MPDKNDITAYKPDTKAVLTTTDAPARRGRGGTKSPDEKRSEKILLSLTIAEREAVAAKAGMVPHATWLMSELRTRGVFD